MYCKLMTKKRMQKKHAERKNSNKNNQGVRDGVKAVG